MLAFVATACTSKTPSAPLTSIATRPPTGSFPATVAVDGRTYDVSCTPVAEALVDIDLPHAAGTPKIRAITGLWDQQAIAVLANDASGCGIWSLGLAEGLSSEATQQIREEVTRGVETFGVTASPVPREP